MKRTRILMLFIALLIAIGVISGEAVSETASHSERHVIRIEAFAFQPSNITVSSGDTIV